RTSLLVIATERMGPHSKGDDLRDATEMERIRQRDPLLRVGRELDSGERELIESQNREFIGRLHQQALASPPASALVARQSICVGAVPNPLAVHEGTPGNVRQQLNSALREMLRDDPRVLLLGEDLHDPYGGAFKVTAGFSTEFPERVIS